MGADLMEPASVATGTAPKANCILAFKNFEARFVVFMQKNEHLAQNST